MAHNSVRSWKACWGQPLTSSNPPSSASPSTARHRVWVRSRRDPRPEDDTRAPGRLPIWRAAPVALRPSFRLYGSGRWCLRESYATTDAHLLGLVVGDDREDALRNTR